MVCLALPVGVGNQLAVHRPKRGLIVGEKSIWGRGKENVHWTQTTMLPSHPLLRNLILITLICKTQFILRIVVLCNVIQNSRSFKHREIVAVVVDYSGDAAIWIDGCEPGFFLGVFHDVDCLVGHLREGRVERFELFE